MKRWRSHLADPAFGKRLFVAMCVLMVIYVGTIAYNLRVATYFYNGVILNMTESEVRYMLGSPRVEGDPAVWRYEEDGRQVAARFNPARRLASVHCTSSGGRSGCQDIQGIGIGTPEDQIWLLLGRPDREIYSGNHKAIHYDGLGFVFYLSRYTVTGLEIRDTASLAGFIPRLLWRLWP